MFACGTRSSSAPQRGVVRCGRTLTKPREVAGHRRLSVAAARSVPQPPMRTVSTIPPTASPCGWVASILPSPSARKVAVLTVSHGPDADRRGRACGSELSGTVQTTPEIGSRRMSMRVPTGTTMACPALAAVMETRPLTGVGAGLDGGTVGGGAVCGACDTDPGPPVGPPRGPCALSGPPVGAAVAQSGLPWGLVLEPQAAAASAASRVSTTRSTGARPSREVVDRGRGGSARSALPPAASPRRVVRTLRTGRRPGRSACWGDRRWSAMAYCPCKKGCPRSCWPRSRMSWSLRRARYRCCR